jgi:hypothetical protein
MSVFTSSFATLSRAAAKHASSRLRQMGLLQEQADWVTRASICERCPLRVIHKKASYCGRPFLQQVERDPTVDGCGCPIRAKAADPAEHCPLTPRHLPAALADGRCNCKWCSASPAQAQ